MGVNANILLLYHYTLRREKVNESDFSVDKEDKKGLRNFFRSPLQL